MKRILILCIATGAAFATLAMLPTGAPVFATVTEPKEVKAETPEKAQFDDARGVFIINSTGTIYMRDPGENHSAKNATMPAAPKTFEPNKWLPNE